jgi:hypothetical protein
MGDPLVFKDLGSKGFFFFSFFFGGPCWTFLRTTLVALSEVRAIRALFMALMVNITNNLKKKKTWGLGGNKGRRQKED